MKVIAELPSRDSTQRIVFDAVNAWFVTHPDVVHTDWCVSEQKNDRYNHWRIDVVAQSLDQLRTQIRLYLSHASFDLSGMDVNVRYRNRRLGSDGHRCDQQQSASRVVSVLDDLYCGKMLLDVVYAGNRPIVWRLARRASRGWHKVGIQQACFIRPFAKNVHRQLKFTPPNQLLAPLPPPIP